MDQPQFLEIVPVSNYLQTIPLSPDLLVPPLLSLTEYDLLIQLELSFLLREFLRDEIFLLMGNYAVS